MSKTVKVEKEKTTLYLKSLETDSLQNIRQKMSQETALLIDKKAHPMASGLMEVLSDPVVVDALSVDNMIKVIDSIFPSYVMEEGWIITSVSQNGKHLLKRRIIKVAIH